jgi:gliding motility-associated-like protein
MQDVFGIKPHSFKKSGVLSFVTPLVCRWLVMVFCSLYSGLVFSQREAFNYIGSSGSYIDWNSYPNQWKKGAKSRNDYFKYASISDKYGKLLFYFDGVNIYNGKHELMKGKQTGLQISEVLNETKAAPFVIPIGNCKYYIVHDGMYPKSNPNQYGPFHLVDMAANDGEGEVKEVFYAPPNSDMMEPNFKFDFTNATLHANGKDIWLLMSDYEHLYSYIIDYTTGAIRKKNTFYKKNALFDNRYFSDRLSFSPKGNYFYTYNKQAFNNEPFGGIKMDLLLFDNTTGSVKSLVQDVQNWVQFWIGWNGNYWYYRKSEKEREFVYSNQLCKSRFSDDLSTLNNPDLCLGKDINYQTNMIGISPEVMSPHNSFLTIEAYQNDTYNDTLLPPINYFTEVLNISSRTPIINRKVKKDSVYTVIPKPLVINLTPTPRFISNFFDSAWVNRPLPSTKAKWEKSTEQCVGQAISFKIKEDLPGESIHISWGDGIDTIVNTLAQELKHVYAKSGRYQLRVERKEACATDVFNDAVDILPIPTVKSNPDTAFLCGSQSILAIVQNPTPDFVYSWSNGNKSAETELKEIGSYTVSASNRCGIAYDTVVVKEGSWNIPNVFTPNADGVNDTWNISSKTTEQAHVKVLNRWGSVVYESEKYDNDWEANNVPDGIYFYQITQNEGCQYKGWVQVVR